MRFIIYSHSSEYYGAPHSIKELSDELVKNNHEVYYILPSTGSFYDVLNESEYNISIIPNPLWVKPNCFSSYGGWFKIKEEVKERIILSGNFFYNFFKHKKFVESINPDYIIVNTATAPTGVFVAKIMKIKSVLWIREVIGGEYDYSHKLFFSGNMFKMMLRFSDYKICPSLFLKNTFKQLYNIQDIHVIPNSIPSRINNIPENHTGRSKIGLVGLVSKRKGQVEFLKRIFEEKHAYEVHVFGHISENDLSDIKQYTGQGLFVHGFKKDIDCIYTKFDIYINLGVNEGFGRTTIEAMSFGKLVLGRDSGATSEIIHHGNNGFLFNDIDDLLFLLERMGDDYDLNVIRENAIETSKKYSVGRVFQEFINLIGRKF